MMQFASSLDPNQDGSYNPLRYYADVFNFVFNGLFVIELGIRSATIDLFRFVPSAWSVDLSCTNNVSTFTFVMQKCIPLMLPDKKSWIYPTACLCSGGGPSFSNHGRYSTCSLSFHPYLPWPLGLVYLQRWSPMFITAHPFLRLQRQIQLENLNWIGLTQFTSNL
jgi:hypothetical protein